MRVLYFYNASFSIMRQMSSRITFQRKQRRFNHSDVRVRFAPSPTGSLHLGGLRTALYNYLYVRSQKGVFILRLEDTDQNRLVPESMNEIERVLRIMGISPDESPQNGGSFGPYIQSNRLSLYKQAADNLIENKCAYKCFCPSKEFKDLGRRVNGYDNKCRELTEDDVRRLEESGVPFCVRLKLQSECEPFEDMVFGQRHIHVTEGDPVILKSTGLPTYHLANVVDDHHMNISHVIRGVEWQLSTPKHLLMYRGLNWQAPKFAHLPQLLNPDGTKLSKRRDDFHVKKLLDEGFSPNVLINFSTMSGHGFPERDYNRLYNMDELIDLFSLEDLTTHSAPVNREMLLIYARMEMRNILDDHQKKHLLITNIKKMVEESFCNRLEIDASEEYIEKIINCWGDTRIYNSRDLIGDGFSFIWTSGVLQGGDSSWRTSNTDVIINMVVDEVDQLDSQQFSNEEIILAMQKAQNKLKAEKKIKSAEIMRTLRLLLSGLKAGPPVSEIMYLLGKKRTIQRLQRK